MLPAYLSYFLGLENQSPADEPAQAGVAQALVVSASVSAGFLAVFTVLGFVIRAGGEGVADVIRYLSIVIGFVLIAVGVAFLMGQSLAFATRLERGGRSRVLVDVRLRHLLRRRVVRLHDRSIRPYCSAASPATARPRVSS